MSERINKYLSSCGVCSRREADRLIDAKRVTIDGQPAELGSMVEEGQHVCVDGKAVTSQADRVLIAFNKPVGIVCTTTDRQGDNNIVDYIGYGRRIYPIGRLDKDSEGLILLTNQGQLMDDILRSANGHEKEYVVTVDRRLAPDFAKRMSEPVYLSELNRWTKSCQVKVTGEKTFKIILTQGLNRQIRRMCKELGYRVIKLRRIRIMNIELGSLESGRYRDVTPEEFARLEAMLKSRSGR